MGNEEVKMWREMRRQKLWKEVRKTFGRSEEGKKAGMKESVVK